MHAAASPARAGLRQATVDLHARLHGLAPFAGLVEGRSTLAEYRQLLLRLHGFHAPFEAALAAAAVPLPCSRAELLRQDLLALGLTPAELAQAPQQAFAWVGRSPTWLLGARYVSEGSTLGGRVLAQHAGALLQGREAGRRFLLGNGPEGWRAVCAAIEEVAAEGGHEELHRGAQATFECFECWFSETPR